MLEMPDSIRLCNDFLFPVLVLGVQLISAETVLAGIGANDFFVVDMQGDPVMVRELLGERRPVVALNFLQVALGVHDAVQTDTVAVKTRCRKPAFTG